MHRLTKGYAAAVALSAVTLLGACTTPATDPPSTASSTSASTSALASGTSSAASSSSNSPTLPQVPEAAKVNNPQGAEAFTNYFGQTLDEAFVSLNADALRALILTDCKSCNGAISAIEGYRERNEKFEGKYAGITTVTYSSTLEGVTKVLAQSRTDGAKVVDDHGAVIKTIPPQTGPLSVQLKFNGQWRVAEVQGVA